MNTIITYTNLGRVQAFLQTSITSEAYFERHPLPVGMSFLEGVEVPSIDIKDLYVDVSVTPHVVKHKQELNLSVSKTSIVADGIDEAVISNVPEGTIVTWPDYLTNRCNDGIVEFSSNQPAQCILKFEHPHHLMKEVHIEAYI